MSYEIFKLDWDSDFFGVEAWKVNLYEEISRDDLENILEKTSIADFITISDYSNNNYLVGKYTTAFLVDNNIQFKLKGITNHSPLILENESIVSSTGVKNEDLAIIAKDNIVYSRFMNDPNISYDKARDVYVSWVINALDDPNKNFMLYKYDGNLKGFILYTYLNEKLIIDLLVVDNLEQGKKIGSKLISKIFETFHEKSEIYVGTQLENIPAVNFYIKNGFNYISTSTTYHLWNFTNKGEN